MKINETRSLEKNRQIARQLILYRIDEILNGEDSVNAQRKRYDKLRSNKAKSKADKRRKMKEEWKIQNDES